MIILQSSWRGECGQRRQCRLLYGKRNSIFDCARVTFLRQGEFCEWPLIDLAGIIQQTGTMRVSLVAWFPYTAKTLRQTWQKLKNQTTVQYLLWRFLLFQLCKFSYFASTTDHNLSKYSSTLMRPDFVPEPGSSTDAEETLRLSAEPLYASRGSQTCDTLSSWLSFLFIFKNFCRGKDTTKNHSCQGFCVIFSDLIFNTLEKYVNKSRLNS